MSSDHVRMSSDHVSQHILLRLWRSVLDERLLNDITYIDSYEWPTFRLTKCCACMAIHLKKLIQSREATSFTGEIDDHMNIEIACTNILFPRLFHWLQSSHYSMTLTEQRINFSIVSGRAHGRRGGGAQTTSTLNLKEDNNLGLL